MRSRRVSGIPRVKPTTHKSKIVRESSHSRAGFHRPMMRNPGRATSAYRRSEDTPTRPTLEKPRETSLLIALRTSLQTRIIRAQMS